MQNSRAWEWIYKYPADSKVYFFEYHGLGAPSADLGTVGDVYLDVTPGRYRVYVHCTLWEPHDFKENVKSGCGLCWDMVQHPFLPDARLWISQGKLTWFVWTGTEKENMCGSYKICAKYISMV